MPAHQEFQSAEHIIPCYIKKHDGDGDMLYLENERTGEALVLCGTVEEIQSVLTNAYQMVVKAKHAPEEPPMRYIQELIVKAHDKGLLRYAPPALVWDDQPANRERQFELRRSAMSGVEFGYILSTDEITWAIQSIDGVELEPTEFLQELQRAVGVEEKLSILAWDNVRTLESALKDVDMFGFGKDVDSDSIVEEAAKSHLDELKRAVRLDPEVVGAEQPCQHYAATRAIVDEEPEVTAHNDEPERTWLVTQVTSVKATDEYQAIDRVNTLHGSSELLSQDAELHLEKLRVGVVHEVWAEDEEHAINQFYDIVGIDTRNNIVNLIEEV